MGKYTAVWPEATEDDAVMVFDDEKAGDEDARESDFQ